MKSASLLVELHTEELPPKSLKALSAAFASGIETSLRMQHFLVDDSAVTPFATPRRLAVHITHVKSRSADRAFRRRLLPVTIGLDALGNATAALLKKVKSIGVEIDHKILARESDGKQDVLVYEGVKAGVTLIDALQTALDEALAKLPIAKAMSYQLADGTTTVQFVRPAHRLIALHGHVVVPVKALGLLAGTKTFGHRFHAPGELAIHSADTYEEQLKREGHVIASFETRRTRIVEWLNKSAERIGASPLMPDELLDEVTALVEMPVVYESGFEAEFLDVPHECLILTMQQNQKYFALKGASGKLLNRFLLVSNIKTNDASAIIAGNARVVRARLADAKFFFDQDRKQKLESRVLGLASVVYHNKLGSQLERVVRIVGIASAIAHALPIDEKPVERAARLAKADLRTLMVGEFPELQGVMGRYYANHDGEPANVADAIEQHYWPRFASDALPIGPVAVCVALADKLETLVGMFVVGEKPTGDKDPYALRRHAIGLLRLLMERKLPIDLRRLRPIAGDAFGITTAKQADFDAKWKDVQQFLYDRLRTLLVDATTTTNMIEAVVSQSPQRLDLIPSRIEAVRGFWAMPEAPSLSAANKRIKNILKKATLDDDAASHDSLDEGTLVEPAEIKLARITNLVEPEATKLFETGDYIGMLRSLAPLKAPVDEFFDTVMVNTDDRKLRGNRLALLAKLRELMNRVADISLLAAG